MGKNKMTDADRLKEQVDEMLAHANVRAEIAQSYQKIIIDKQLETQREVKKYNFMLEALALGERTLKQHKEMLLQNAEPPQDQTIEALTDAIENLKSLVQQSQGFLNRSDGALSALNSIGEVFHKKTMDAVSRARGLPVQGERAIKIAERKDKTKESKTEENSEDPRIIPRKSL